MPTLPPERHIMTVTGRIEPAQLGPTLPHEHLYCDLSAHSGKADNDLTDVQVMAKEFRFFRTAGGCSIVDVTPAGRALFRRLAQGAPPALPGDV